MGEAGMSGLREHIRRLEAFFNRPEVVAGISLVVLVGLAIAGRLVGSP